MRPKLLHLFNSFEVGGVERQHMMLVNHLTDEYDQICWSYCHGPLEKELDDLGVCHYMGGADVVETLLAEQPYDAIAMRTNRFIDAFVKIIPRFNTPLIYIKDYLRWFDGNMTYLDPKWDALPAQMATEAFYCGPSLVSGLNAFDRSSGRVELMPNGLDLSRFPMNSRTPPKSEKMRIGILANLTERKNQLAAIEVLKEELKSGNCTLELAGDFLDPKYVKRLKDKSAGLSVNFHGYVSDPIPFLNEIDVLLMTSTLEGWPVAIMEAMACGVPVIAPIVGDIPELLDFGTSGFLYPLGQYDHILDLINTLKNKEQYQQVSLNGINRVRSFDIKNNVTQFKNAFHRMLPGMSYRE